MSDNLLAKFYSPLRFLCGNTFLQNIRSRYKICAKNILEGGGDAAKFSAISLLTQMSCYCGRDVEELEDLCHNYWMDLSLLKLLFFFLLSFFCQHLAYLGHVPTQGSAMQF